MPITHVTDAGLDLYVLFDDDASTPTAVDMTEGATYLAGVYTVSDAALVTASLAAGTYTYRIKLGTVSGMATTDTLDAVGTLYFDGTNTLTEAQHALANADALGGVDVSGAYVDAHVVRQNNTPVIGDGTSSDPWRGDP